MAKRKVLDVKRTRDGVELRFRTERARAPKTFAVRCTVSGPVKLDRPVFFLKSNGAVLVFAERADADALVAKLNAVHRSRFFGSDPATYTYEVVAAPAMS